jgi:hypothetical protein
MLKKWGVLLLGVVAAAAVLIGGASAVSIPIPTPGAHLTDRAAIVKYLAAHGLDAKQFVIQRGARNYAGKHCPGLGWTCTTSKRVVQISFGPNVTQFTCTPSANGEATPPGDCLVVQFSTHAPNSATCIEKISASTADQRCRILQTSSTGSNLASVQQQVDATTGATQSASQDAEVEQDSSTGTNSVQVTQVLNETTTTTAAGLQQQDGYQTVSVLQNAVNGTNNAKVVQSLALKATAQYLPSVTQSQNTNASYPNTAASIVQTSGSGTNVADLNQSHDLDATLTRVTTGSQTQGNPSGGLLGHFDQSSSGLSTVKGVQNELQELHATGVPNLTQTQFGPGYFGSDQGSSPVDRYNITQTSTQNASSPGAFQDDQLYGNCDTTGVCTSNQTITQDGTTHTNTCTAPSCHIGEGSTQDGPGSDTFTCSGVGTELPNCPFPPPPPPPPFSSD